MERQAGNPARSRIRLHHTFCHSLTKGRRSQAQGYLRILDLLFGHGRLDFLDEAFKGAQRRPVTVMPLDRLTGSANRGFVYDGHSLLL